MSKLTLTEFREIKNSMLDLLKWADNESENNPNQFDMEKALREYILLQDRLLSSNLSDIPFEEWQGLSLYADGELDLSKTHANIDFSLLDESEYDSINLHGCNVRGIQAINYDENTFDAEYMEAHPEYFPDNSIPAEVRKLFYDKKLEFKDLIEYPALRKYVNEYSFSRAYSSSSRNLVKAIGYENAIRFFDENPEFVNAITSVNYDFSAEKPFDKSGTYEEAKQFVYRQIINEIKHGYSKKLPSFDVLPQEMIDSFPNVFIKEGELPEKVVEDYYSGNLSIHEIRNYSEVLKTKDLEFGTHVSRWIDAFNKVFGDVWKFIEQVPKEYDRIVEKYLANNCDKEEKMAQIAQQKLPDIIFDSIRYGWDVYSINDYNLDELYAFSQYVPIEEIFKDTNLRDFVQRCGFENIVKFNRKNNMILDRTCSYRTLLQEMALNASGIGKITDEQQLSTVFGQIIHSMRAAPFVRPILKECKRELSRLYPSEFLDYNMLDTLLKDMKEEDKAHLIERLESGFNEDANLLFEILDKNPFLLPAFANKSLIISKYDWNLNAFYQQVGNEKFLDMWSKYRKALLLTISSSSKETMAEFISQISGENYEQQMNQYVYDMLSKNYDGLFDLRILPQSFKSEHPELFLDENAPKELKEVFYNGKISPEIIQSNSEWKQFLQGKDISIVCNNYFVKKFAIKCRQLGFDNNKLFELFDKYGSYLASCNIDIDSINSNNIGELDNIIRQQMVEAITVRNVRYDESARAIIGQEHPEFFLDENASQEIKNKFYNKEFTVEDFINNSKLFEIFDKTNIAIGFSENMSWIIPLFENSDNLKMANYKRMKVILEYSKIQDYALQDVFKKYIMKLGNNIDLEKIKYASEVLPRLSLSNSSEIFTFREELATQILKSDNPLDNLSKIEDVFIRNNIPTVGKIYSCFEILHPDFKGFNFENSTISPVLQKSSTRGRKIIVFADLIKSFFGSNNRSVNAYLKNIEFGSSLYRNIKNGQIQFDLLSESEKQELVVFRNHLATMYNNTMKAKMGNQTFISSGDVLKDILNLSIMLSPDGTLDYNLADRVIRMFCGFTGIDTLKQAKDYIDKKVKIADTRNRNASSSDMTLEQGDFIKGIGNPNILNDKERLECCFDYLKNILQNGSVSKEFLGSSAGSDCTPLDTDISMIMSSDGSIREKIDATVASVYDPIWFVLKNDDRFITTRTRENFEAKRDMTKLEVFYTGFSGEGHYGIRTGFASSEINYIVMENYDPRVGLEIAMNGFYIPVANKEGKIVFTPKDYDQLREKMSGLSYFGEQNYSFSENLVTEETKSLADEIEQSNYEIRVKREKINNIIKKSLEELGLHLKTSIDENLTEGFVELIDTGSTGRGTNKPGDGDFDFMMRLDKKILSNFSKLNKLKQTILSNFGRENSSELTGDGDFRLKNVQIDNDTCVDIDITFIEKTDKVLYSTDMALQDRLATIQRTNPEKYKYVVANIILAKQVLKKAEAYKPNHGEIPQGGLGGVGIENWILQNGGSFIDAAKSFVESADGKSFSEFQSTYQIWDFGDNHLAERRRQRGRHYYAHDNFVANNMSEGGYQKMVQALKEYLKSIDLNYVQDNEFIR